MVASVAFCSDSYGQGLLGRMMNRSCCDPAPSCCDTPKDTCGCGSRAVRFQLRLPNLLCGCGQMGGFFKRGCGCQSDCNTGCNDCCDSGGLLSRFQFGLRLGNNCGCGCQTPVTDSCNDCCGGGLLSSLRGRFASMGCGCNSGCDDCCGGGLFSHLGSHRGCGCGTGCRDRCRPSLFDRLRAMVPSRRCGCDSGCNSCGQASPAKKGSPSLEPTPGDAQPSESDKDKSSKTTSRLRTKPTTAPRIDPRSFISPRNTISIGR